MVRSVKAARPAGRSTAATFAVAVTLSGVMSTARAATELAPSALAVRNAIVAMALADAAIPLAVAASSMRDDALVPTSSAAMKPEMSVAMASMKPASSRSATAGFYTPVSYDRRARPYHVPFPLILGIGY